MTESEYIKENGLDRAEVQEWRKQNLEKGEHYLWDVGIRQIVLTEIGLDALNKRFAKKEPEVIVEPEATTPVADSEKDLIIATYVGATPIETRMKGELPNTSVIRFEDPKRICRSGRNLGRKVFVKPIKVPNYSGFRDTFEFVRWADEE